MALPCLVSTAFHPSYVRLTAEGRGAASVYRDRGTGKITTKEEFAEARKDARTKEREAKAKEREERVGDMSRPKGVFFRSDL